MDYNAASHRSQAIHIDEVDRVQWPSLSPIMNSFGYNGKTKEPKTFSEPVGRLLPGCEKLSVVTFEKIACFILDVSGIRLRKNQKYLYNISCAIQ